MCCDVWCSGALRTNISTPNTAINAASPVEVIIRAFGTGSRRRFASLFALWSQSGATIMQDDKLYGAELDTALPAAAFVYSPALFFGNTFPPFLRIAQCINHGVAIVVEDSVFGVGDEVDDEGGNNNNNNNDNNNNNNNDDNNNNNRDNSNSDTSRYARVHVDGSRSHVAEVQSEFANADLREKSRSYARRRGVDPQVALAARLGGVHFASYDNLEETALHLLRQPKATRLTDGEVAAWQRFASDLWAWDGTLSSLRRLFGVPVTTNTEARCAAHELDRSQERPS